LTFAEIVHFSIFYLDSSFQKSHKQFFVVFYVDNQQFCISLLLTHTTNGELNMKKMLSLAAMFAVLSYASPASAELKIGGDFSARARAEFNAVDPGSKNNDDLMFQYRLRLNGAADLGDGYFFKTLIMSEDQTSSNAAGGWRTVGGNVANGHADAPYSLSASQVYFGRNMKECNYKIGRIPLNSFNNPIFDLTLYPAQPLDTPVNNFGYDRLFGASYGTNLGSGTLSTTLVVLDNASNTVGTTANDGIFNDGYALSLAYNTTVGKVTIEPQVFAVLTNADVTTLGSKITPLTFGATVATPVNNSKLSLGGFYTTCDDTNNATTKSDYSGYLIRVKGESGPFMAWIDYNRTTNDLANTTTNVVVKDYTNTFVWAQYKHVVYKGAAGSFSLQPTVRYRTASNELANGTKSPVDASQLRGELVATVTF
jgi:hypothetical protein